MYSSVVCGWGGKLYILKGGTITPANQTLVMSTSATTTIGAENNGGTTEWITRFFGGENSYHGEGYVNHKPGAFYHGKFYLGLQRVLASPSFYPVRFDGSGIFTQGGTRYSTQFRKFNGRGSEFLGPSGAPSEFRPKDLCTIVHNNNLFFIGNFIASSHNQITNNWKNLGWHLGVSDAVSVVNPKRRGYKSFVITYDPKTKREKKIAGKFAQFSPDATLDEDGSACDAISVGDDIYFANWIDIVRFPGGSGTPQIVESIRNHPSAKCFCYHPISGYANGVPQGNNELLYLAGSGVIKKVIDPSGTRTLFDVKYISTDVRTGNAHTRVTSSTAEPGRSPFLASYNNKLRAFVTSATSGYRYYTCNGIVASGSSWTDETQSLPDDLRRWDGNVFGYVDKRSNRMYLLQTTMSEVGLHGDQGAQKGAGGAYLYEFNSNEEITQIGIFHLSEGGRGLIPYMNTGPYLMIPSGSNPVVYQANDYAIIEYYLFDHYSRNVNVNVEYSTNNGATWHEARRFKSYTVGVGPLGSGISSLPTSPIGIKYDFYWDYVNDIGFGVVKDCLLRISPRLER